MESSHWLETANTILATLETALFGESAVDVGVGAAPVSSSRKHTRKANSDTMSDIEMPGSPVKRRRESVSTPTDSGPTKPTAKCRRITSALSNQFARSLSMSGGLNTELNASAVYEDHEAVAIGFDTDSAMSSAFPSSTSSSSSISSVTAWPSSGLSIQVTHEHANARTPEPQLDYDQHTTANETTAVLLRDRVMRLPVVGRSIRAREKMRAGESGVRSDNQTVGHSQSSMDTDIFESISPLRMTANGRASANIEAPENSFATLLKLLPLPLDAYSDEKVRFEIQEWAQSQAQTTQQTPEELVEALNQRVARLKDLVPAILESLGSDSRLHVAGTLYSDVLRDFYCAALEMAAIGDWLCQRQFHLLPVVFPTLHRSIPQLKGIVHVSRVSEDMYELVQQLPIQFSTSLCEMSTEYEEFIYVKRALYNDMLCQDGLSWKAMGVPIDAVLLTRVRQRLCETTEQCLTRVARVYERRARSASAYDKEDISTDSLLNISHQVLHTAALCVSLCGNSYTKFTPHVMYIAAESISWTTNKILTRDSTNNSDSHAGSKQAALLHGKKLDSRARRLVQVGESMLKLLAYVRVIVATSAFPLDAAHIGHQADLATTGACETLSTSLVDFSWMLAETMTAYRVSGKLVNPSGNFLMYAELVVKFAKRQLYEGQPNMFRNISKVAQRSVLTSKRAYITHVPRVSSMGNASSAEHATVQTYAGDVTFNEDIAIERFHEKAIATDSMRAAANFDEIRVVPSASSNYQNINVVYGQ
ncbi:hypothetical protein IWW56_003236 [Coemansia sp. RSA 2131]|nr:hypothetical protein IWW56_003236 [Coemansia sp. RSA 2131]